MRKLISIILSIALIVAVLSVGTVAASVSETAQKTYDFSNSNQLADFIVAGPDNGAWGNWQTVDGKLQVTGNAPADWWGTSIVTKNTYDDFTLEFDADVSAGYGIFLRAGDDASVSGQGLNSWFGGNTYALMHWAPCENNASVEMKNYGGSDVSLAFCGSIGAMSSAHWSITASGNTISFVLTDNNNSANTLSYTFTDANSLYLDGRIGFYNLTKDGITTFKADNLVITGNPTNVEEDDDSQIDTSVVSYYDFSDKIQANDFFMSGPDNGRWGDWQVADNVLKVIGNSGAGWWGTNFTTKADYSNFKMEFDAVVSAGYGVFLRVEDDGAVAGQGLNKWFSGNGYMIAHYSPVEDFNSVKVINFNGAESVIAEAGSLQRIDGGAAGNWVHWTIVADDDEISFTIADRNDPTNTLSYTLQDSTYSAGHIGFYNLTCDGVTSLQIDNLTITGAPASARENVVWSDNFNGETGGNYTAYGCWWNNYTSFLTQTEYANVVGNEGIAAGWSYYYLNGMEFSDFSVDFDVVATSGSAYGLMVRAGNPCGDADGGNGYGVMYDGAWSYVGAMDGTWTQVCDSETGPYAYNPGDNGRNVHHWRVTCEGYNIKIYFNYSNLPAFTVYDETFTVGSVGFRTLSPENTVNNLLIDNFIVSGYRMGDVNGDNAIDVRDLVREKKYFADNSTEINLTTAKLNSDGNFDANDMAQLKQYLLGKVSTVYDYT